MTNQIIFTDAAVEKVQRALTEEDKDSFLRVYITGGGCSGFQYGFTLDKNVEPDDTTFEKQGVKFVVDPMSFQYLAGATIDYKEDLQGAQFVITNPNAQTTCGCGSSFTS